MGIGAVRVRAPRVNDKRVDEETGRRQRFASAILPAWCRKSPKVTEVLPLLYLHGLSSKDFGPALEGFLGSSAGLSAPTITRLTTQWQDEARTFNRRDLSHVDYLYVWADGVHLNIRLDEEKLCLLVLLGVRVDGTKELVALADGYRESTGSWADLLRDCKRHGMRAPVLAIGDGALGFWGALREVFPETREQRCWFHKIANVLAALPKIGAPGSEEGPRGDLERRGPRPRPARSGRGQAGLRRQVRQGRRQGHRRSRRAAGLLRLPGRGLDPFAHNESHRVDVCHRAPSDQSHQGPGVQGRGHRHGVQTHRGRTSSLACRQRATPRRARAQRRHFQERQARRTHHRSPHQGGLIKISHPQVLTNSLCVQGTDITLHAARVTPPSRRTNPQGAHASR